MPAFSIIDQRGGLVAYGLAYQGSVGFKLYHGQLEGQTTPPPPKPPKKPPLKPSQVTNWALDWP